jgi:hypothetical protein
VPSWSELQHEFARALRDPGRDGPVAVVRRSPAGVSRRFNVYRNNVVVSLVDALKATFPAVQRLVGEEYFVAVAKAYIDEHPPLVPVLLRYGESFGDFLDGFPSASGVPYLGDVARLEWARINALHAPDAEPAGIETLSGIPESRLESVILIPHPSLAVIFSRWPAASLWAASLDPDAAGDVDLGAPEQVAVLRPALEVAVRALPPGVGVFLDGLGRGSRLGDAAQQAMDAVEEFDLAAGLELIFRMGAVAHVNSLEEEQT